MSDNKDFSWVDIFGFILIASLLNADENIFDKLKNEPFDYKGMYSSLGLPIPEEIEILGNEKYKMFRDEVDEYTRDFISNHNCNKYNSYTEYTEYYIGLNRIRLKYGLGRLVEIKCPYGVSGLVDENRVDEFKKTMEETGKIIWK